MPDESITGVKLNALSARKVLFSDPNNLITPYIAVTPGNVLDHATGNLIESANYYVTDPIDVESSTTYISKSYENDALPFRTVQLDESGGYVSGQAAGMGSFTTSATTKKVRFALANTLLLENFFRRNQRHLPKRFS